MKEQRLLKVCGMKSLANISDVLALQPDFIGFIFYKTSKRYMGNRCLENVVSQIVDVKTVGIFVNASTQEILNAVDTYRLDYVQLHGDETPEFCQKLYEQNIKIIKAFQVNESFDFSICSDFEDTCSYFLFDTQSKGYGGSGQQFNWYLLQAYKGSKAYFLSGGIGPEDAQKLKNIKDDRLKVIDINSRFENEDGLKRIEEIKNFKSMIQ